jgi:clan AA aspartic protease
VNPAREPVIAIQVRDINGTLHARNAIVDTGFTGWLTLPQDLINTLGLPWKELGAAVLADRTTVFCDVYSAALIWDGHDIMISVDESESESLVGMALMSGYRILIEDLDGGSVQIERM